MVWYNNNMKKLGIILDSFSGITKKEANALGFEYLSLQVILDGKMYKEGIDFESFEKAMELVSNAKDKKTSQPNLGDIEDVFEAASKKYEKTVYLCIGSKMSSTSSTANMIANNEYENQIFVFNNSLSGPGFIKAAKYIQEEYEKGQDLNVIFKTIRDWEEDTQTWIVPEDIEAIQKGGRVKKGAKFLLSKLSIIPMIFYRNSAIEVMGVRRGFAKAISTVINRSINSIEGGDIKNYEFHVQHTGKDSTKELTVKKLNEAGVKDINVVPACVANGIQCGIGAISVLMMRKKIKA